MHVNGPSSFLRHLLIIGLLSARIFGQTNVLTQHNDIGRTGLNSTETILTPANVGSGAFGKLYSVTLDGRAMTQPLYVSQLSINGVQHSVLFVATEHDSVYALDANAQGQVLWQASLLDAAHGAAPGATSVPIANTGCPDSIGPEYGITGTPVIDLASGTLYVVSKTLEGATPYPVQRVHALDITTGNEKFNAPVTVSATVAGTGNGSVGGQLSFDPKWENQRAGLLFINNTVYVGWGSHCDLGPWHGWIMGYSPAGGTLQQTQVWVASPNGSGNGIWLSGLGLAADQNGPSGSARMFVATGNGDYDGQTNWGESLVNLNLATPSSSLPVTDSFTPNTEAALNLVDYDVGSAGTLILPDLAGTSSHPHLVVQLSKAGVMFLLDRDNLGGYNATADQALQEVTFGSSYGYGIWGGPAYFNNNLYVWPANSNMSQYSLANGLLSSAPVAVNAYQEPGKLTGYYNGTFLGATPSISANGVNNGIVWANDTVTDKGTPTQILFAFNASNVAQTIWSSPRFSAIDGAGTSQKFGIPTIADGRVYLASNNSINVFGLLPAPLVSITVTPVSYALAAGATQQFIATGVYGDSSTQDLTSIVSWTSSSAAATISSSGLATGVAEGSTTITASLSGISSVPVPIYVNGSFPNTTVGSASVAQNVYFTFSGTTNLAATPWVVLTDGAPNLDFQAAATQPANVCQTGHTYNAGDQCVVSVVFNPTTVGVRAGAVQLIGVGNSAVATSYINGTGACPALAFTPGMISTVAGNGTAGYSGDSAQATAAKLSLPSAVAMDGAGNLYIADAQNNVVRKVDTTGTISTVAGTGTAGYSGDNGPAASATLNAPQGVALDGAGNLYISDTNNSVVREVSTGGIITTIAGTGTASYGGDGGAATSAQLNAPYGLAVDGGGNLYIADSGNSLVRKVSASGIITTVAGTGIWGYSGDGTSAIRAQLASPFGVAVDNAGNLYIADSANSRVRKVNASGIITTLAGNGTTGYTGDGGTATSAELALPAGVAVDSAGNLYIADATSGAVRKVDTLGIITTVAGNGTLAYSGDAGPATSAALNGPTAVAVASLGNLYIADASNNAVRMVKVTSSALALAAAATSPSVTTQNVLVSNVGAAPLNFSAFTISSSFTIAAGTNVCAVATALAPGTNCVLPVALQPTAPGTSVTGALTVADNAPSSPQTIGLSGLGLVGVTINTSPSGLAVSIDGGSAQTAPVSVGWKVGDKHTIATASSQGSLGTRYTFTGWSDGTAATSNAITVTAATTSYTANFNTLYLLSTFFSPAGAGAVTVSAPSPTGDGYYPANTQLTLTATARSSDNPFSNWIGNTTSTSNPLSITMSAPTSETANFGSSSGAGAVVPLAYEPFGEAAGTPLSGASGSGDSGWGAPWLEQAGETVTPGYETFSANPLTYTGLATTSGYAIGGYNYQSAGRQLNVASTGPFSAYLSNGLIGASGQTVWLSFLLREDANPSNGQINAVFLTPDGGIGAWLAQTGIGIGYFGTSPYWGVQLNNGTPVLSSVPVVQGQTVFLVVGITFGATNEINLYVNPTSLGGAAPATPSLQVMTAANVGFQTLSYLGGYQTNVSSLGDIRFGSSYAAVTPVQTSQTITFTAPTSPVTYPVAPITLAATASSGLPVTFSVLSGPGSVTGNTLTVTGTGTIVIAANQAGNGSYAAAPQVTQSIVVNTALSPQTITFTAPASPVTYPVAPITLSATASSGLAVTFSVLSGPGSITGNTLTVTGTGTIVIAANQAGNGSYAAATQVTQSIVVNALSAQTITFTAPASPVSYPVAPITLSATASSGLTVTFSVLSGPGSITGNTLTVTGTGTIVIAANQAGNGTYAAAPQVTQSIVVGSLSSQTITFTAPTSPVTYPVAPITLSATASSGLTVTFSVLSGPGSITGNTLTVTGTGTIVIAANQAGNATYAAAPQVTQSIVVNSLSSQTITFTAPTSPVTYPVAPITLSATASSGLTVTFSVLSGPGSITGNTLTVTGTGTIVIAANQAGNATYAAAPKVTKSIVVNSLSSQTITFTAPTSPVTYPVAPITLSATASSGLTVTFSVLSGPGSITGNTLTVTGTGTIVIAANQAGNATYAAAPQVTQSIVVNSLSSQTITFTAPTSPVTYPVSPITLSATATSGLAVSFSVLSGPGSITGSTLTVTGTGTIVIAANQAGNATYAAAPQVTQSLVVNASGTLFAYEPFGETAGTPLSGATGSGDSGWNSPWVEQFGETAVPGYETASANPLTYTGLATTSSYAIGGYSYQSAGRQLNVASTGPFSAYLNNGFIGASGQTVWLSFLLREDANPSNGQINAVFLTPNGGISAWLAQTGIGIGYFGSSAYWGLQLNNGTPVLSNVPVVQGQAVLMVASITFGATNQVNLYVNPTSLGGSAPATASAKLTTGTSVAFQTLSYLGGYQANVSSLGDIRFGSSYAAVTPTAQTTQSQTITFTAPTSPVTYPVSPITLSATASSGLTVTFSLISGPGSITGNTLTVTGPGTIVIAANQAGNSSYAAAPQVTQSIVVNAASGLSQTITFTAPTSPVTYPVAPITLSATASSGLPVTFSVFSGPGSISGNTLTVTGTGTIVIAANQAGNATYAAAPQVTQSIVVNAGTSLSQTITFTAPTSPVTYPVSPITLSATASSGLTVTFSVVSGPGSITGNTLTVTGTGTIVIAANQAGNSSYAAAPQVTQSIVVNAGSSGSVLAYEPFGEASGTPLNGATGSGDSGWAAAWVEQTGATTAPGYQTASANPLTYASLATTSNYATGGYVYQSAGRQLNVASTGPFSTYLSNGLIGASGQTVWLSLLLREDANPSNGQINAVFLTPDSGINAWVPQTGIGIGYFGSSAYWGLQLNNGTPVLSSVPVVQGQTVLLVASITFGATNQINLYVNPTSLGGTAPATASATLTTAATVGFQTLSYLGGYQANVSSLGDIRFGSSYAAVTPTTQTTQSQTITFTAPASPVTYPVAPITLSATASSGLAVTFSVLSGPGSITGNTLTVTGTGTIVIAANQAGNSSYSAAPQVTQSIVVNAGSGLSQTITFTAPTSPVTYPLAPITLSATASSGLTVTFSVLSGPGSITGNTLTVTGTGTIVIAANQAGNSSYAAAPQVTQSIVVNAGSGLSQTITFTAPTSPVSYPVAPITLSATASSGLTVTFSVLSGPGSITGSTLTVTGTGTIVIAANQAGNSTYAAAPQVTQSIVVNAASSGTVLAYEPFGETSGTPLSGATGSGDSGWNAPWVEQTGETAVPGYETASANPLTYTGLATSSSYAIGGYVYQSAGRQLNVTSTGPFSSYLSNGLIGASGQTVWLSFLLREDGSPGSGDINALFLTSRNIAWVTETGIGIGYFGTSPYWGLQLNGGTAVLSSVPVQQGQAVLMVVSITFGATNQINLYVNPALGSGVPATPSAQLTTASNVAFQSLSYLGGYTSNKSSLGTIRFGTSYGAVTPAQ